MSQTIKAINIVDDDTLVFEVSHYLQPYILEANGNKCKLARKCVISYKDKDNVYYDVYDKKNLHYINSNQELMSIIDFEEKSEELSEKQHNSLEDEFKYRKFLEEWKLVSETETITHKIDLDIVQVTYNSGSKYITPIWNHSSVPKENQLYALNVCQLELDVFNEECDRLKLKRTVPTHSHLRFAQIEGKYCFSELYDRNSCSVRYGNLEFLKKEEAAYTNNIKTIVQNRYAELNVNIRPDWVKIVEEINECMHLCSKIEAKTRSTIKPYHITSRLKGMINILQKEAHEKIEQTT